MRLLRFLWIAPIGFLAIAQSTPLVLGATPGTYRCVSAAGKVTYSNAKESMPQADTCTCMDCEAAEVEALRATNTPAFRQNIKRGDKATIGLIIEVNRPIAKVQTDKGERWFRIDELEPL